LILIGHRITRMSDYLCILELRLVYSHQLVASPVA
jgi:hypothetical protein